MPMTTIQILQGPTVLTRLDNANQDFSYPHSMVIGLHEAVVYIVNISDQRPLCSSLWDLQCSGSIKT